MKSSTTSQTSSPAKAAAGLPLQELREQSAHAANILKSLAHQTRLLILCHIGVRSISVLELTELLETSQSNVSQHLAKLRAMDILVNEKVGNQVFYRIKDPATLDFVVQLQRTFCPVNDPKTRRGS